ncbi:adenosylcobinamide-GDP ribazoletransferase [Bacillus aquiflavi]|uniref:Adenosylcobinamide-GDP ribazoletransferase n=2 Tax=Bacillus aquiflavi TaxID=2672567 RepID=A0A7W2AEY2_9BACI|nr:adenosylcobinamide-GDP ribazoletransferase [Bacillus aquiflavi]MBA4536851.1 adenosylcobinamide-GDP ribazoletransferase [Bacillus aquiflavi]
MNMIRGFFINLQFFTSIPIPFQLSMDKQAVKRSVQMFPILGILQGLLYASILYGLIQWTPFTPLASAFLFTLFTIIFTGGLHLDGWIDTSDAFFSYREKEKRLEIMKDPRVGAFGVLSVIILLSSRFFFFYEVTLFVQPSSYFLVALVPFLSRSMMGYFLLSIQTAKKEGLGYFLQQAADKTALWIYPFYFFIVFILLAIFNKDALFGGFILLLVIVFLATFFFYKIRSWFGGITGDVLGASVEGAEAVLWMTVWLLHYFVMG